LIVSCPSCQKKNRLPPSAKGFPRCGACRAPLPWLVESSDGDFEAVVEEAGQPVLVDVWAPWCGPCRLVAPVVEQVARDMAGQVKVVKVNADESPGVSARLGVQSIPTLIFFRNGKEVDRVVGALPAAQLMKRVQANFGSSRGSS